jgi:bacterioferritin
MHHLEILGSLIARLGASPVLTNYPPYPVGYFSTSYVDYSRSPQRIVTIDLAAERQAIADYEKMICCLKNERVSAVIARIVEDERVHVQALEGLQKTLCG